VGQRPTKLISNNGWRKKIATIVGKRLQKTAGKRLQKRGITA
jgi:hypothetical protein